MNLLGQKLNWRDIIYVSTQVQFFGAKTFEDDGFSPEINIFDTNSIGARLLTGAFVYKRKLSVGAGVEIRKFNGPSFKSSNFLVVIAYHTEYFYGTLRGGGPLKIGDFNKAVTGEIGFGGIFPIWE